MAQCLQESITRDVQFMATIVVYKVYAQCTQCIKAIVDLILSLGKDSFVFCFAEIRAKAFKEMGFYRGTSFCPPMQCGHPGTEPTAIQGPALQLPETQFQFQISVERERACLRHRVSYKLDCIIETLKNKLLGTSSCFPLKTTYY